VPTFRFGFWKGFSLISAFSPPSRATLPHRRSVPQKEKNSLKMYINIWSKNWPPNNIV